MQAEQIDLRQLPGDTLVAIHNTLDPVHPVKAPWKAAKSKLIERIFMFPVEAVLRAYEQASSEGAPGVAEEPAAEEPEAQAEPQEERAEEPAAELVPAPDPVKETGSTFELTEADRARLPEKAATIRETSLRLLAWVHFYEDKNRPVGEDNRVPETHPRAGSVGLTYNEIIRIILSHFPDAKTTVACLRWYAVKVRAGETNYDQWRLARRRPRLVPGKRTP